MKKKQQIVRIMLHLKFKYTFCFRLDRYVGP